ncbi:MAG TPA: MerR family transcriptional regulator [Longimicrobiaceae bacterium]|nr:MerR family transcriptional regulator [Longimicrobiaceae bacterium]
MRPTPWKVGELARQTGLTVRTLHHYDEIGLLTPSHHTATGHRLYGDADIARLQQIRSLRQLGFSLEQIGQCLDSPTFSPQRVIQLHVARLREQIELQRRLCERLESIAEGLQSAEGVSAETFIQTIEDMTMFEKYYTPEQLEQLKQRREEVGEARIQEVQEEWPRLMAEVRAEMERGTAPEDPRAQELARRWKGLVREFTGGDPGIFNSLKNLYQGETTVHGMDVAPMREMQGWVSRALAAAGESW